jgi:hypothetical protein
MRQSYWPDPDDLEEPPSEARRLIEEAARGLAEDLRAEGEPNVWDYIGSVFDEIRGRGGRP